MRLKIILSGMLLGLAQAAGAQTLSASLSEDSAQVKYGLFVAGQEFGRTEFSMGVLFNDSDEYVAETGLLVVDEAGSKAPGLTIGLGGKLYGASSPGMELMALGLGGKLRYNLPALNKRLTLGLDLFYAPSIVTYLDAERFSEGAVRLEYAVLRQASLFVEGRQYRTKLDGVKDSVDIGEGGRLGLEINF